VIILDTNVISELMRAAPDEDVMRWVSTQDATTLFLTSVTVAEILHGVMLLPAGRRRRAVESAAESMFKEDFADRILPFAGDEARSYAKISADRHRLGRPISQFDAQIAAIARTKGATLATRNIADFEHCGIKVIDPWTMK
jgi:predicted nucleic acid-binding protein